MIVERSCYRIPSRRSKMREANRLAADYQSRRIERNMCIVRVKHPPINRFPASSILTPFPPATPFRAKSSARVSSSIPALFFRFSIRKPISIFLQDLDFETTNYVKKT